VEESQDVCAQFKLEFPEVYAGNKALGEEIHERSGPLQEKARGLHKIAILAARRLQRPLETHLIKARASGARAEEIKQTLLLLVPAVGFPGFMRAYSVFQDLQQAQCRCAAAPRMGHVAREGSNAGSKDSTSVCVFTQCTNHSQLSTVISEARYKYTP
jgi:alkylhydroperoxidase/carboxymuconolactone decarboxylase family protein YurZ